MVVSVQFCGVQRALTRTNNIEVPILEDSRVEDVLEYIKTCYPKIQLNESDVLITVNNTLSTINRNLSHNDKITFLPPMGGG